MANKPLNLLNTFLVFTESKNITEASKKLFLTQPAVSVQLQSLEDLFRWPLFIFQGKKKILTRFGMELRQSIIGQFNDIKTSIEELERKYSNPSERILRIGARREIIKLMFENLKFEGKIHFSSQSSKESIEQLMDRVIDVAVGYKLKNQTGLIQRKLFSDNAKFIIHKDLVKNQTISLENFLVKKFIYSIPFVTYNTNANYIQKFCKKTGLDFQKINIKTIIDSWDSVMAMTENNIGCSIIPDKTTVRSQNLLQVPIPDSIIQSTDFYITYHKELERDFPIDKIFYSK